MLTGNLDLHALMHLIDLTPAQTRTFAEPAMPRQSGMLGSESVYVIDTTGDSKEEAGMYLADSVYKARKSTDLRLKPERPGVSPRIEDIEAYLDATHRFDNDPARREQTIRSIQQHVRPDVLVRQLARKDPAMQFALLQAALQDAARRAQGPAVAARLQEAIAKLTHEASARIQAGLNTVGVASQFARTADGVGDFQRAYSDIALGNYGFDKTFETVLRVLGGARGADFARALAALRDALGADIGASRPSTDATHLRFLVQEVYRMEVFVTVLEDCTRLADAISARFGITTVEPAELMKGLVGIIGERWVMPQRLAALATRFGIHGLLERVAFHTGTWRVLRRAPVHVFPDDDARQSVLDAAQEALNSAVGEEEARHAS